MWFFWVELEALQDVERAVKILEDLPGVPHPVSVHIWGIDFLVFLSLSPLFFAFLFFFLGRVWVFAAEMSSNYVVKKGNFMVFYNWKISFNSCFLVEKTGIAFVKLLKKFLICADRF